MKTVAHYITSCSIQHGAPVRPGACPTLANVWRTLFEYMGQAIATLNTLLASGKVYYAIFYRILDLFDIDLDIIGSPWLAHLKGFFSLVDVYGGVKTIMSGIKAPSLAMHYGLLPVTDQIFALNNWNEEDILRIYCLNYFAPFPCPSQLALALHRITRLRVQAVSMEQLSFGHRANDRESLVSESRAVSIHIAEFSPRNWVENYDLPDEPLRSLLAQMFQTAVMLYGLLSLPPTLSKKFIQEQAPMDNRNKAEARQRLRAELLSHIGTVFSSVVRIEGCCWPLAILGVASYDATQKEQDCIIGYLNILCNVPGGNCGALAMLEALPKFWASGKTDWEQCFDQPCQCTYLDVFDPNYTAQLPLAAGDLCGDSEDCKALCVSGRFEFAENTNASTGEPEYGFACSEGIIPLPPVLYLVKMCGEVPATAQEFSDLGKEEHDAITWASVDSCKAAGQPFYCHTRNLKHFGCPIPVGQEDTLNSFDSACDDAKRPSMVRSEIRDNEDLFTCLGIDVPKAVDS
ncbi:hypothetical protein NLG97_g2834 [Lecanicillium saksenae]|uniref:Uncharacterized protein n=1 Tax=Lecanicillium saksenae TaxID=468837 RepID=A0ACC1R1I7_9HYPO|nr:hypothetical protein NLG97_g2834 [Lecanicillium saksenae]